jgi:hypothetical protein
MMNFIIPHSFENRKIGKNMINTILNKSIEKKFRDILGWGLNDDVEKVKKRNQL